jgi:hypothetical protein
LEAPNAARFGKISPEFIIEPELPLHEAGSLVVDFSFILNYRSYVSASLTPVGVGSLMPFGSSMA